MWSISTVSVSRPQMMHGVHVKLNPGCHGKSSIQQVADSFRQQIRLKFKEETIKVLKLGHSFVWCCNADTSQVAQKYLEIFEMCGAGEIWKS
jgi:hypothetical protein